jgi:hypothetical protein
MNWKAWLGKIALAVAKDWWQERQAKKKQKEEELVDKNPQNVV